MAARPLFLKWGGSKDAMGLIDRIADSVMARGDLAHLALLLWAAGASLLCRTLLRDLEAANKRFDAFVRELARFNRRLSGDER
jgi:hypothetical protein